MKTNILSLAVLFSLALSGPLKASNPFDRIAVTNVPNSAPGVNAVPNNSTPDTAGIMAAVNYAFPAGSPKPTKSIYFPAGTYIFEGTMTLEANTSYRLYGEGPGVSTIIFTGSNPGITASVGTNTLQIEGLTLQCNVENAGTAISASFTSGKKAKSATIRNVQIIGSTVAQQNAPGYWRYGIDLEGASNAVIEDVQIQGSYTGESPFPDDAIHWHAAPEKNSHATQLFVHNLSVLYYKTAVRTSGHVEGLYMSGFELVFCGNSSTGAMEITAQGTDGESLPVFNIMNGHINQLTQGIRMSNVSNVRISHVIFLNHFGYGNHIALTNVGGAKIVENDFVDFDCGSTTPCTPITHGNGIYLFGNTQGTRISGNSFGLNNVPDGSAIVVESTCTRTSIFDNDFGDTAHTINNMAGANTVIRNIPFPP